MKLKTYAATLVGAYVAGGLVGAGLHHLNLLRLAKRRVAEQQQPQVMTMTLDEFEQAFGPEAAAGIRQATEVHSIPQGGQGFYL